MQHPACPHDAVFCRITEGTRLTTLLASPATRDGEGRPIGPGDPNTVTTPMWCSTCRRKWTETTRGGRTTVVNL